MDEVSLESFRCQRKRPVQWKKTLVTWKRLEFARRWKSSSCLRRKPNLFFDKSTSVQANTATFCINKKGNIRKSVTLLAHLFCYCPCRLFPFPSNIRVFRVGHVRVLWKHRQLFLRPQPQPRTKALSPRHVKCLQVLRHFNHTCSLRIF